MLQLEIITLEELSGSMPSAFGPWSGFQIVQQPRRSGSGVTYNGNNKFEKGNGLLDQRNRLVYSFVWSPTLTHSDSAFARSRTGSSPASPRWPPAVPPGVPPSASA